MALIKCNECGQMISDKAMKCPKCGNPVGQVSNQESMSSNNIITNEPYTYENETSGHKWIYTIIGVLTAALVGLGIWAWQSGLFGNSQKYPEQIVDGKSVTNVEKDTSFSSNDNIDNQSMNLKGKIGKYPITMHLEFDNNIVNGYYSYNSGSSKLLLTGTINNNHIELNETTDEGRPTGHFDGELTGDKFAGEFINYKGEHFNFKLANSTLSTEETRVKEENEYEEYDTNEFSDPIVSSRTNKWTGASSESELRQKLDGTSWETTYDVLRYKVIFSNGMANMIFTDLDGSRYKSEETYKYEIKEVRGCFFVNMGYSIPIEYSKDLEYSIVFKDDKVFLFSNQKVNIGELIFLGRN